MALFELQLRVDEVEPDARQKLTILIGLTESHINGPVSDPNEFAIRMEAYVSRFQELTRKAAMHIGDALDNLAVLSIGNGGKTPFFWMKDFDLGLGNFSNTPTNPPMGNFYGPTTFLGLDAPSEDVDYEATQLLGRSFFRLEPQLFGPPDSFPALPASLLSRFMFWQKLILAQIEDKVDKSAEATDHIAAALKYLNSPYWILGS